MVKLQLMFPPGEADEIKQITVGGPTVDDFIAWNYTKNGEFTVRSAYHLGMTLKKAKTGSPGSSSSIASHKAWMSLWDTVAPGRMKIHTWRLIRNGLAVGSELHRRKIKPGVFCPVCGREETNIHRFWRCPHSAKFWTLVCSELGTLVAIPPDAVHSQGALSHWL